MDNELLEYPNITQSKPHVGAPGPVEATVRDSVLQSEPSAEASIGNQTKKSEDPPWDQGMTPQERADAKRRYKNRKGVERWRRRKQAQRAREREEQDRNQRQPIPLEQQDAPSTPPGGQGGGEHSGHAVSDHHPQGSGIQSLDGGSDRQPLSESGVLCPSSKESSDDINSSQWREAGRMLHEFQKLGKVSEAKMKALLDHLASFAMIPHGFQRYKGRVIRLAEEILGLARNGAPTTTDVAQRFLDWGIRFNAAWEDPIIPNFQQILRVFANGKDSSTFVNVALQDGSHKTLSLKQLSQLDEAVHKELYISLIHQILRAVPVALLKNQAAARAKANISKQMKQASMIASGYVIGQFVSFTGQRAIRKNVGVPMQNLMFAAASLGLRSESCQRMWQIWDAASTDLEPLVKRNEMLERRLDSLLALHDISDDGSYHAIFNAVEQLMQNFEEQFDVSYYADLKCSHELLNPLQLGFLAAAQIPKLPIRQILAESIDPYARVSVMFESGVLPRYF